MERGEHGGRSLNLNLVRFPSRNLRAALGHEPSGTTPACVGARRETAAAVGNFKRRSVLVPMFDMGSHLVAKLNFVHHASSEFPAANEARPSLIMAIPLPPCLPSHFPPPPAASSATACNFTATSSGNTTSPWKNDTGAPFALS